MCVFFKEYIVCVLVVITKLLIFMKFHNFDIMLQQYYNDIYLHINYILLLIFLVTIFF